MHKKFRNQRILGTYLFWQPNLTLMDPELVQDVFIKDFDHWSDRRHFESKHPKDKIQNEFLSQINGPKWKNLRSILSTSFTTGRMKSMFPLIEAQAGELVEKIRKDSMERATLKPVQ